jgi:hypothetical protein
VPDQSISLQHGPRVSLGRVVHYRLGADPPRTAHVIRIDGGEPDKVDLLVLGLPGERDTWQVRDARFIPPGVELTKHRYGWSWPPRV